jgi:hypothetical protein
MFNYSSYSFRKKKLFILFKILIQIYKIISYILNSLSNKTNHNIIYDFYKNIFKKMNSQSYIKKSTTIIIKIQREYMTSCTGHVNMEEKTEFFLNKK